MGPDDRNRSSISNPWRRAAADEELASRAWGILLFGVIGATVTTLAVCQLRRSGDWFYMQLNKTQSNSSWDGTSRSGWGRYKEDAWRRYNRRLQEEHEEEMQRVERIRRMQRIFNREKAKYKRSYQSWRDCGPGAYQHFQQNDWYWHADSAYKDQTSYRSAPVYGGNFSMSHHYSLLVLDRSREEPYSDAEIKTAFRATAMKWHPDQNPDNKEAAEVKFKEIMASYDAIKSERITASCL